MNRKRALEITYLLWDLIATGKVRSKVLALRYLYTEDLISKEEYTSVSNYFNCPCCAYATVNEFTDCNKCPLKDFWLSFAPQRTSTVLNVLCERYEYGGLTPWDNYRYTEDQEDRREAARQIADAAKKELEDEK